MCLIWNFQQNLSKKVVVISKIIPLSHYSCSVSRWRPQKVDKRMVGCLCFSTLSASSLSRVCKYSITFLGCFISLSSTSLWIDLIMAWPSSPRIWQLVRIKLISCFVNKQLFVRKATLTCSKASSLVLFTTVLELPLAMMLTAVVLLVIDRKLLGKRKRGGWGWWGRGGERCHVGGRWVALQRALPLWRGWGAELSSTCLSTGFLCLCPFPRFVPFSFLSWAISYKPVLGFPCISVRFA